MFSQNENRMGKGVRGIEKLPQFSSKSLRSFVSDHHLASSHVILFKPLKIDAQLSAEEVHNSHMPPCKGPY